MYIKGIHNTVADAISRLDSGPVHDERSTWMTFAQCWSYHNATLQEVSPADTKESMNMVFANQNEEDSIYPLTTREIAEAQQEDESLLHKGFSTKVLCTDGKMVIPKSLHHHAVAWFHHYLQHPGTKRLKETLRLSMYWKGLQMTVQSHIKRCHSCQVNKRRQLKYGKLPTKLAITNPWEALYVDLIGPFTLKGKDKTQIDFMCITMIDPATSWFEIVELPVSQPNTVNESDIADFLTKVAWVVSSTYHTVLKTSPGSTIFGRDMLFDIPYIAEWSKIGEYRQEQTDNNTRWENVSRIDWDYQPGDQVLLRKDGILRKTESRYESDPWTITSVHTNGTIRVQCGAKLND
eukprot:CCRYP_017983-RA/>CCRYP_017983-RA protein AED:0.41 eAED:0.41 QI:0/0/0/1/1/1/2/0/348